MRAPHGPPSRLVVPGAAAGGADRERRRDRPPPVEPTRLHCVTARGSCPLPVRRDTEGAVTEHSWPEPYPSHWVGPDDRNMSETPEDRPEPTTVASESRPVEPPPAVPPSGRYDRPSLLSHVLAWVGIVAGVVFIVAVIFFSGFFLGGYAQGYHGYHGRVDGMEVQG